ncbi:hypothetical protein FIBSPDRAFT_870491, partial [Athelia psychrophila]
AQYGSVNDTVYPPHSLHTHWNPKTNSVDDPSRLSSLDGSFITKVLPSHCPFPGCFSKASVNQ